MFVYVIVNSISLKIYVGKHKGSDLQSYFSKKFYDAQRNSGKRSHLFAAMRKYPRDSWSIHPLFEGQTNEEICEHEKVLIKALGTQHHEIGYNICDGGEGFTGSFTPEHRAKLSKGIKASWTPERRAVQSAQRRGIPRPPQVGEAVRRMRIGSKASAETKEKIRAARLAQPDPRLGKHHSEESKKRISEGHKGQIPWMKGKHHTDESNGKNRQAHLLDLQGQQFGNVLVVSLAGISSRSHAEWAVRCTVCNADGTVVRSGRVRSGDSAFMRAHLHLEGLG